MCKGFSQILKEGIQSTWMTASAALEIIRGMVKISQSYFVKLFSYEQDVTQSVSHNKAKPHPSHCVELKTGVKRQGLRNAIIKTMDYRRGPSTKLYDQM